MLCACYNITNNYISPKSLLTATRKSSSFLAENFSGKGVVGIDYNVVTSLVGD